MYSRKYAPNGAREVARRLRQIQREQLKVANGLDKKTEEGSAS